MTYIVLVGKERYLTHWELTRDGCVSHGGTAMGHIDKAVRIWDRRTARLVAKLVRGKVRGIKDKVNP